MKMPEVRNTMNNITVEGNEGENHAMLIDFDSFRDSALTHAKQSKILADKLDKMNKATKLYRSTMGEKAYEDGEKKADIASAQTLIDNVYLDSLCADKSTMHEVMKAWMRDFFRPVLVIKANKDSASATYDAAPVALGVVVSYAKKKGIAIPENMDTLWHTAMLSMYMWQIAGWGYTEEDLTDKKSELAELFPNDTLDWEKQATTGYMERAMQDVVNCLFGLTEEQRQVLHFKKGFARRYNELDSSNKRNRNGNISFASEPDYVSNWSYVFYELMTGNNFAISNNNK